MRYPLASQGSSAGFLLPLGTLHRGPCTPGWGRRGSAGRRAPGPVGVVGGTGTGVGTLVIPRTNTAVSVRVPMKRLTRYRLPSGKIKITVLS